MLMNDKINFDCYNCINSAQTKQIVLRYISQPCHIFIKAFILMLVPGRAQLLINRLCFACCPVTSINKCGVLSPHHMRI